MEMGPRLPGTTDQGGAAGPQAAGSLAAVLPDTLPPGEWWKVLNPYPETVSCITYRSELFIIPPGLQ